MSITNKKIIVNQLDTKIKKLSLLKNLVPPEEGWINLFRKTLNMSLRQLADRMQISIQGASKLEKNEAEGAITINTLRKVGDAMNLTLVYGFLPKDESLEKMIERKAAEIATKIVMRTSATMKLEDQEVSSQRLKESIDELTEELKKEMPKSLWD
jgi:predicted DNA-binding mobile mystery protein A